MNYGMPHCVTFSCNSLIQISPQLPVLRHNFCSSLDVFDQASHPYKTRGKTIVFVLFAYMTHVINFDQT